VNKDGSSLRRLFTFEGLASDFWLDWSENDKIIVGCDDWNSLIFVDTETGDTTSWQYDPSKGKIHRSRLSPDGRLMAVTRGRVGTAGADIWIYSMANDSSSLVIDFPAWVLNWSRDNRWVHCFTLDWVIARVNVETSEIDTLAMFPDMDAVVGGHMVAMAPDGDWAIYQVGQVPRDIYLIENFDPNVE